MEDKSERPSWHEFWKDIVLKTATRSPCKRLHVGCLLVRDNRVISQGYNGYLPGCAHEQKMRDGHEMATIHAEMNTITDCANRGVSCKDATAYITNRRDNYPRISDQLDLLWHAIDADADLKVKLAGFYNAIKSVKDTYPKP